VVFLVVTPCSDEVGHQCFGGLFYLHGDKCWETFYLLFCISVKLGLSPLREHRLRIFENWVLRRIFVPKTEGVIGGWRKVHNEEQHNLYSSLYIIRVIKSRRMKRAGKKHTLNKKFIQNFSQKPWKDHLGDLSIDGMIILKWIMENTIGGCEMYSSVHLHSY